MGDAVGLSAELGWDRVALGDDAPGLPEVTSRPSRSRTTEPVQLGGDGGETVTAPQQPAGVVGQACLVGGPALDIDPQS
jgi:hypothetical protein